MDRADGALEILDRPVALADRVASLADIDRLNAWFGGYALTLREIRRVVAAPPGGRRGRRDERAHVAPPRARRGRGQPAGDGGGGAARRHRERPLAHAPGARARVACDAAPPMPPDLAP